MTHVCFRNQELYITASYLIDAIQDKDKSYKNILRCYDAEVESNDSSGRYESVTTVALTFCRAFALLNSGKEVKPLSKDKQLKIIDSALNSESSFNFNYQAFTDSVCESLKAKSKLSGSDTLPEKYHLEPIYIVTLSALKVWHSFLLIRKSIPYEHLTSIFSSDNDSNDLRAASMKFSLSIGTGWAMISKNQRIAFADKQLKNPDCFDYSFFTWLISILEASNSEDEPSFHIDRISPYFIKSEILRSI